MKVRDPLGSGSAFGFCPPPTYKKSTYIALSAPDGYTPEEISAKAIVRVDFSKRLFYYSWVPRYILGDKIA